MSKQYAIGVIPGDGIGPEVISQGLRVLTQVSAIHGFAYELVDYPWSSALYLDTGQLMPASALEEYRQLDALYLGALGDPRVERGLVERSVLMAIRMGLDLYVNLRPIVLYDSHLTPLKGIGPDDVDLVVVRENTEDVYVGLGGVLHQGLPDEVAVAEMIFTRGGVERALRYGFELARERDKQRKLTVVDKANAIRPQEIWRRALADVAAEYPDIQTEAIYADSAAMYLIQDPARFDVIVTTNLFGDILTDLGAAIQGGLGGAASGNIHPGQVSMFEPIHGSAPDIAGRNVASPIGAIAALAMLLDFLGERAAALSIEGAIRRAVQARRLPGFESTSGLTTVEVGDIILDELRAERDAAAVV